MKFKEVLDASYKTWKDTDNEISELRKQLSDLEKKRTEEIKTWNYNRLAETMAAKRKADYFTWVADVKDENSYGQIYKRYDYRSMLYDFSIIIRYRDDLKKWKYEVEASGDKYNLSESTRGDRVHDLTTYRNYTYVKDKYMTYYYDQERRERKWKADKGHELTKKFTTLEEAELFANEWKEKLLKDHEEVLKKEKALYDSAKVIYNTGDVVIIHVSEYDTRQAFLNMMEYITDLESVNQWEGSFEHYKIKGKNIASTVKHMIEQYKMNIEVIAG